MQYEYKPSFCTKCHNIGYETGKCDEAKQNNKKRRERSQSMRRKAGLVTQMNNERVRTEVERTEMERPDMGRSKVERTEVERSELGRPKVERSEVVRSDVPTLKEIQGDLEESQKVPKKVNADVMEEVQETIEFGKDKVMVMTEEKLVMESLTTILSEEDRIHFSKLRWTDSHVKMVRGSRSESDDLQTFFSGIATEEKGD